MQAKTCLTAGICFAGTGVVLGAFGAHGLETLLTPSQIDSWQTAVQYQLLHGLALLVLGVWMQSSPQAKLAASAWLLILGITLFSGSIYLLLLTELRWLGPVTPLGGLAFIAGWVALLWAVWAD